MSTCVIPGCFRIALMVCGVAASRRVAAVAVTRRGLLTSSSPVQQRPVLLTVRAKWPLNCTVAASASSVGGKYNDLEIEQIREGISSQKLVLVDVRTRHETESTGVIPSSIVIPLFELSSAFHLSNTEFVEKYEACKPSMDDMIAVYCRSGTRAMTAYDALRGLGYNKVWRYPGSWLDWADNNPGTKREPDDL